jgi:hypothetical protein
MRRLHLIDKQNLAATGRIPPRLKRGANALPLNALFCYESFYGSMAAPRKLPRNLNIRLRPIRGRKLVTRRALKFPKNCLKRTATRHENLRSDQLCLCRYLRRNLGEMARRAAESTPEHLGPAPGTHPPPEPPAGSDGRRTREGIPMKQQRSIQHRLSAWWLNLTNWAIEQRRLLRASKDEADIVCARLWRPPLGTEVKVCKDGPRRARVGTAE